MPDILHLSTFLHRPIFDSDGDRIGRVQDLVARLGDDPHPPIVGAVIKIEGATSSCRFERSVASRRAG